MAIGGTYRIRKTLPAPDGSGSFVAENLFRLVPGPGGTLTGAVDTGQGEPIPLEAGYQNGDYFKIVYTVGPGKWEICAWVEDEKVFGVVSIAGGGSPDRVEGEKISDSSEKN